MKKNLKILLINLIINSTLLLFTFVNIQNVSERRKINFIFFETINFPLSFILSSSFIAGTITGTLFSLKLKEEN